MKTVEEGIQQQQPVQVVSYADDTTITSIHTQHRRRKLTSVGGGVNVEANA